MYTNQPVALAELEAPNVEDKTVPFIEVNRPYVQRALVEQLEGSSRTRVVCVIPFSELPKRC